jgi:hypothetical protein
MSTELDRYTLPEADSGRDRNDTEPRRPGKALEVGKQVVVAGAESLLGPVAKILKPVFQHALSLSSQARVDAAISHSLLVDDVASEIAADHLSEFRQNLRDFGAKITRLEESFSASDVDSRARDSDIRAIVLRLASASARTLDHRRRRMLAAVMVGILDPVLYREGLLEELVPLVEECTYIDVRALQNAVDVANEHGITTHQAVYEGRIGFLTPERLEKLVRLGLLEDRTQRRSGNASNSLVVTNRGKRFLELLRED